MSKTDLDKVIATIEDESGPLHPGEIAHCFEHDAPITAHGVLIPKIDPSRIQEETGIRFVLFKMALTTGWDCPRAEVMMSFRRAQDDTLIAQLIGRMVRTPLARRIEGSESLNSVSLYLPHYDKAGLTRVVNHLKQGDPMELPPTDIEDGAKLVTFKRDKEMDAAFEALTDLPCYRVERVRKISNTFNDANDRIALNTLADLFPAHRIVGIHAVDLVWGLGTLHCLTQQQPAPRSDVPLNAGGQA